MPKKYIPNILIVDDQESNLLYLEIILRDLDAKVIKAMSGKEALSKIKGYELALAVLDLQMPEIDGFELAQLIKKQKKNHLVPIILLTAHYSEQKYILKGYESGAIDFLTKPIEKSILLNKIKIFLELDRQKHQILNDKLKLKKTEKALIKSEEELRAYAIYFDTKVEEEKKMIAAEVHDGLGQLFTILKMDLLWMKKKVPPKNIQINEKFDSMRDIIDSGVKKVQEISGQLRPGMLDDLGLLSTIQSELSKFQERTDIKCRVDFEPLDFQVDFEMSTSLYRIFLEALINIYRHSGATSIKINLTNREDELLLRMEDNGKGIPKEKINSNLSFGLIGMRERVKIWNGTVEILGKKGKGTTITVRIPI